MNPLLNNDTIRLPAELSVEDVEHDLVILDRRSQKIHHLNATASFIWVCLNEKLCPAQIINEFTELFDISHQVASDDISEVLQNFLTIGLIEIAD